MMIKAVFFDLDGTVADTNGLIYESFRRLFHEKMGLPVPDEEIYGLFGEPLVVSLKRYGAESEEFLSYYRDFNEGQHDIMIREFDGVKEALESLKEKGIKLGIVTSKRERMARRSLERLQLLPYFDVIVTPELTTEHKPNPAPLLKACELMGGISPKETLMVGDSAYDILCGNRAGAASVAVSYSKIKMEKLLAAKPTYVVDDLRELLAIVEGAGTPA